MRMAVRVVPNITVARMKFERRTHTQRCMHFIYNEGFTLNPFIIQLIKVENEIGVQLVEVVGGVSENTAKDRRGKKIMWNK